MLLSVFILTTATQYGVLFLSLNEHTSRVNLLNAGKHLLIPCTFNTIRTARTMNGGVWTRPSCIIPTNSEAGTMLHHSVCGLKHWHKTLFHGQNKWTCAIIRCLSPILEETGGLRRSLEERGSDLVHDDIVKSCVENWRMSDGHYQALIGDATVILIWPWVHS